MAGGPSLQEIASIKDGRDITRGYISGLLSPEDRVLRETLGGDLTHYERILRDDQVKSTMQQRITAVTQAEMEVEPGDDSAGAKEAADMLRDNLKAIEWDRICSKMLYGLFYGYAVSECMWSTGGNQISLADIIVRKQRRFRFDGDKRLMMLTRDKPLGELMPDRKFWTFSTGATDDDEPYGLGLAHWLYWPVFFKRQDMRFWLIFLEKFAQPTPSAVVPPGKLDDAPYRQKVLEMLHAIQTDSAVLIPDGVTLELLEAKRSGTADYAKLVEIMDAAISKVVLSQTMTTDNGSSLAQAKVHEGVGEDVKKADADLLCGSFNRGPAKWLTCWNFGENEDGTPRVAVPRVWRKVEEEEDLSTRAERDTKIYGLGFEPTEEYIAETYGEGWVKRETPVPPALEPAPIDPGMAADFSELQEKFGHRGDQADIAIAAREFANNYPGVIGDRVRQLVALAEQTDDFETFEVHMADLLARGPAAQTVTAIENPGVVARLKGLWRAQR